MTRAYHIVGAFDRFNYGDVLFAHLAARAIRDMDPDADVAFYGTHSADLTRQGGVKTAGLKTLYGKVKDDDVVWIAGGEVLGSRWTLMAEHNMARFPARLVRSLRVRLGVERLDPIFRVMARVPNRVPWVFDPTDFHSGSQPKVIYNAVGGRGVAGLHGTVLAWVCSALARSTWISVRDHGSQNVLGAALGAAPKLAPDPAVLMNELTDHATLDRHRTAIRARTKGPVFPEHYISLQCGINYYTGHEDILGQAIERLHATTGLAVVLFAIGRASGHEDHLVADRLASRLGQKPWLYVAPDDLNIWEIMALIAGADCYIGTSLHGFVTAFTYGVPRVGLSPRVGKIVGFRDAWDVQTMPAGIEFSVLPEAAVRAMAHDKTLLAQRVTLTQSACRAALRDIADVLRITKPD
jgi:hypothetical protein